MIFPNCRFIFAEITSELKSSEISSLLQICLNENEKVSLASSKYYLYFNQDKGKKIFWGRKIVGFPQNLPTPLFYQDFGGEKVEQAELAAFPLEHLTAEEFWRKKVAWEEKFDQKIQKMLLSIDLDSHPMGLGLDIFVE